MLRRHMGDFQRFAACLTYILWWSFQNLSVDVEKEKGKKNPPQHETHVLILSDKLFVSCSCYGNNQEIPILTHTDTRADATLGITAGFFFCLHIGHKIEIDPSE